MSKSKYKSLLLAALICLGTNAALAQSSASSEQFAASESAPVSQSKPAMLKRPKIGLALGGGGARGAAHVGVLKTLIQEGVPIDMIAGTSIGSVVGGLYSSGMSPDAMADKFSSAEMMKEFSPMPIALRVILAPIIVLPRLFKHPYDGLYKGVQFRNYINTLVPEQALNIENMRVPFAAVVTNVVSGKSDRITHGPLGTAVQASTAVPGLRKPVEVDNQLFCDGGLINNLPVNHVRDMGADFIIAVNIDEPLRDVPLKTFRKMGSMSKQALRLQLFAQDDASGKTADVVIHPDTGGIGLISRSANDAKVGLEAGQQAAKAAMPEIRAKLKALGIDLDANSNLKAAGR